MKTLIATLGLATLMGQVNFASAMSCTDAVAGNPEVVRNLQVKVEAARKKTNSEAAASRIEFIEAALQTKAEVLDAKSSIAVEEYNATILKAAFVRFKKEGWERVNPFAQREGLLDAEKAMDLLILDGVSFSTLAHDLGASAEFNALTYFNDFAPHVVSRFQFEAFFHGVEAGFNMIPYFEVALKIQNGIQLRAFRLGIDAGFNMLPYYDTALDVSNELQLSAFQVGVDAGFNMLPYYSDIALNVRTEEQLAAVRRGARTNITNIDYYTNLLH